MSDDEHPSVAECIAHSTEMWGDEASIKEIALAAATAHYLRELESLRIQNVRLRMQLVACGAAAMAPAQLEGMLPEYDSASRQDITSALDELRAENARLREQMEDMQAIYGMTPEGQKRDELLSVATALVAGDAACALSKGGGRISTYIQDAQKLIAAVDAACGEGE